jgi:hypothetical protein
MNLAQIESLSPVIQRAKILIDLGIPVCLVKVGEKGAFEPNWPSVPITSLADPRLFDPAYVNCNVGAIAYAKLDGIWLFEIDSQDVRARILADTGHDVMAIKTFMVRSREGRGHLYFKQTAASIAMGNLAQSYVKHGDFSVRVHNEYVVGPGSFRAKENSFYETMQPVYAPIEAPQWLIDWLVAQKIAKKDSTGKNATPRNENNRVPHGSIHPFLVSEAGKLRHAGLDPDVLEVALINIAHNQCEAPIDEDKVKQIARSIGQKEPGDPSIPLKLSSKPDPAVVPTIDTGEGCSRPEFPIWAVDQTSVWKGLVEPAMATSSKHGEFIFMPAMQMIMNYLSGKVGIKMHTTRMNMFVGLISPYGQFFKSSSCKLAHDYCRWMNIGAVLSKTTTSAVAKRSTLVAQAGSPEGFGLTIQRLEGSKAILYNDELGKFVSKAGIESSSFADDLLTWYGAADFGNNVTTARNNFNFEGGTYTFGWLWCTTDRGFNRHWPKLAGIASGLVDRMFFVVSPEKPKATIMYKDPDFVAGAEGTKRLINAAIAKKDYEFEDPDNFARGVAGLDPRSMELVMNISLFLAIDMGKDMIDDDVMERALALVEYRNQAAAFLAPIEADNLQGRLQKEIIRELKQNRGKMSYRDLCRNLDFNRYGVDVWNRAYKTMLPYGNDEGIIFEFPEQRTAGKRATRMVGLIQYEEDE